MRTHYLDYIDIYRWDTIADREFEYGKPFEFPCCNCIIKVPLEQIVPFFKRCEAEKPPYKYVILSPRSDFGIEEQRTNPVNADLVKRISFIPWNQVAQAPNYVQVPLGPACDAEHCKITDKYSVKCYAHTCGTFENIPDCVHHWFSVNVNVNSDRITCIPMGLGDSKDAELIYKLMTETMMWKLQPKYYVNFTNYTQERSNLKVAYGVAQSQRSDYCTVVDKEIPKEQYYTDIMHHEYVLCPYGNGLDCYRNLEVLYLGGTPIVHDSIWSNRLCGLFGNRIQDWYGIDYNKLQKGLPKPELLNFSFWQQLIYRKIDEVS